MREKEAEIFSLQCFYTINPESLGNIPDIHENLCSDLDKSSLGYKIAKNIFIFSNSLSTSIFEVKQNDEGVVIVGCAINVNRTSTEEESCQKDLMLGKEFKSNLEIIVKDGKSVAFTKKEVDTKLRPIAFLTEGFEELAILVLPDVDGQVKVLAVLSMGHGRAGKVLENQLILDICRLSGICMKNAADFQSLSLEVTRSQVFLDLARVIFENQTSIELTVLKILANLLVLIECEQAQILLVSRDSSAIFKQIYDLDENDLLKEDFDTLVRPFENRFPVNRVITGLVASLGETVNIQDTYCK